MTTTYKLAHAGKIIDTRSGKRLDGADGYYLADYAAAADVALDGYATREEAEAAARKVEATPDIDGVAIGVRVEAER